MRGNRADGGRGDRDGDRLPDLLHRSVRAMRHEWAEATEKWGVSPHQSRALSVIGGRKGPPADRPDSHRGQGPDLPDPGPRLSVIADRLHIAPRSATEVVDGLEELGLVERVPDPADRRATCVRLTDKGAGVQAEIWAARAEIDESFFGRLDTSEQEELRALLRKLLGSAPSQRS